MWMLFARAPPPDAPYWPGRRWLAAVDALAWPLAWVVAIGHADPPEGIIGPFLSAGALLCAFGRLRRALWINQRYQFTTWRWGRVAAALLVMGALLKLVLSV